MPFAQAASLTRTLVKLKGSIESRQIVSNTLIHQDLEVPDWCLPTMSPNALATLPHPDPALLYHFLFWTFDGHPNPGDPGASAVDIPPMGLDCVHRAVKWYYVGGGPGDDIPRYFVWAFNMSTGSFSSESPIAAPADAVGQNVVVTQDQPWTLVARDSIGAGNLAQPFHHWWRTNADSPQAQYDKNLDIDQGMGGAAIAFYGQDSVEGPEPPDWEGITRKPVKDALAEVKRASYDFQDLFDFSIYERLTERIDRLEQQVHRGRSFINRAERPDVCGHAQHGNRGK